MVFPYVVMIAVLLIVGFYPTLLVDVINSGVVPLVDRITDGMAVADALTHTASNLH